MNANRGDKALGSTKRLKNAKKALRPSGTLLLLGLFLIGFALRLPGLLFNGMGDLDEIHLVYGCSVRELGIAKGFGFDYGLFSYALYGIAVALAERLPRYWWAPYKLMEVSFEVAALLALYVLLPARRRYLALIMYWLNPWFILHGAWQGFWEGPHTLFALIGILCLGRVPQVKISWALAGIAVMASAMFKPQGLLFFVIPLCIYLGLQFVLDGRLLLLWFTTGLLSLLGLATMLLTAGGGDVLAIPRNYLTVAESWPNLCNDCINIWRPVTRILQVVLGQTGLPTYMLQLPAPLHDSLDLLALSAVLALVVLFCLRIPSGAGQRRPDSEGQHGLPPHFSVFLVLAFSSLMIPQLGTRAHMNHAYAGLVLLIPFAAASRRILAPWGAMVGIHFYSHLAAYQLGRSIVLPQLYLDYPPAQSLISQIQAALAAQTYDPLLQFQAGVNQFLTHYLPSEPLVSVLSAVQFICLVLIAREMFGVTAQAMPGAILASGLDRQADP